MLISDQNLLLLSATSFDTVNTSSNANCSIASKLPFIAACGNNRTIDGCEVNRVKFVHCDNFGDGRLLHVGAENEKKCGDNSGNGRTSSMLQNNNNNALNDIQNNKCAEVGTPMSNSLNSSNSEATSKCQNSNSEMEALLIGNDSTKSIAVRKANNTSLIFTKKDLNPVVHRKKNVYMRKGSIGTRPTTLATPTTDSDGDTSSGKRHSFHWQDNGSDDRKRKQVKSLYAIISSADTNEVDVGDNIEVSNFIFFFSLQFA